MISETSIPVQKIETLLRCPVCLDRYNNPRILPCQHTFCQSPCLEGLINYQHKIIKCPQCRAEHHLPVSGSEGFPANITLSAFLDLRVSLTVHNNNTGNYCAICEQPSQTSNCFHCNKSVCAACKHAHSLQARNNILWLVGEIKKILPSMKSRINDVKQNAVDLENSKENVKTNIRNAFETFRRELQEREKNLLEQVETITQNELGVINMQQEKLELDFVSISSYCEAYDNVESLTDLSENDLVSVKQKCTEYIACITRAERVLAKNILSFQNDDLSTLRNALAGFGRVSSGEIATSNNLNSNVSDNEASRNWALPSAAWVVNTTRGNLSTGVYTPSWSLPSNLSPAASNVNVRNRIAPYMYRMDTNTSQVADIVQQMRMDESQQVTTTERTSMGRTAGRGRNRFLRSRESESVGSGFEQTNLRRTEDNAARLEFINAYDARDNLRVRHRYIGNTEQLGGFFALNGLSNAANVSRSVPPATAFEVSFDENNVGNVQRLQGSNNQAVFTSSNVDSSGMDLNSLQPINNPASTQNANAESQSVPVSGLGTSESASEIPLASSQIALNGLSISRMQNETRDLVATNAVPTVSIENAIMTHYAESVNYKSKGEVVILLGQNCLATDRFRNPCGIAVSVLGDIIVADSGQHRVQIFDCRGQYVRTFGCFGSGDGELNNPVGIACNKQGQIVVTDSANSRLLFFDRNGQYYNKFDLSGSASGDLAKPVGVCVDNNGTNFVCDKALHCVQVISCNGLLERKIGLSRINTEKISCPEYVAIHNDYIYVTDSIKHHIQVFARDGGFVKSIGQKGSQDGQFRSPAGIAIDREGNIVVCDKNNNRVQIFDRNGLFMHKFGCKGDVPGQFRRPEGVAVSSQGQIIVSDYDNNSVQIF